MLIRLMWLELQVCVVCVCVYLCFGHGIVSKGWGELCVYKGFISRECRHFVLHTLAGGHTSSHTHWSAHPHL